MIQGIAGCFFVIIMSLFFLGIWLGILIYICGSFEKGWLGFIVSNIINIIFNSLFLMSADSDVSLIFITICVLGIIVTAIITVKCPACFYKYD